MGKAFAVADGLVGILLVMRLLSGANTPSRNVIISMETWVCSWIGCKSLREPPGGGKVKVTELKATGSYGQRWCYHQNRQVDGGYLLWRGG